MKTQRKYKLHRLGVKQEPEYDDIFSFIDSKFLNLERRQHSNLQGYDTFHDENGIYMFRYHKTKEFVTIKFAGVWEILMGKHNKYQIHKLLLSDLKIIVLGVIETTYQIKIVKSNFFGNFNYESIK